jgi:hypothetical protein
MTDQQPVKAIRLSTFREEHEDGSVTDSFGIKLESPMKADEVWEMLVGGLVAAYKTTICQRLGIEEFIDETADLMDKMLENTSTQTPIIN